MHYVPQCYHAKHVFSGKLVSLSKRRSGQLQKELFAIHRTHSSRRAGGDTETGLSKEKRAGAQGWERSWQGSYASEWTPNTPDLSCDSGHFFFVLRKEKKSSGQATDYWYSIHACFSVCSWGNFRPQQLLNTDHRPESCCINTFFFHQQQAGSWWLQVFNLFHLFTLWDISLKQIRFLLFSFVVSKHSEIRMLVLNFLKLPCGS